MDADKIEQGLRLLMEGFNVLDLGEEVGKAEAVLSREEVLTVEAVRHALDYVDAAAQKLAALVIATNKLQRKLRQFLQMRAVQDARLH